MSASRSTAIGVSILRKAVGATLIIVSMTAFAGENSTKERKQAWEWATEERIANRLDPGRVAERNRHYQATRSGRPSAMSNSGDTAQHMLSYVIDGGRNPELFLPHELFAGLLTGVVTSEPLRSRQRDYYRAGVLQFGFDEATFWRELELLTIAAANRQGLGASAEQLCREEYDMLQAARRVFGTERFDRFLYAVIAPSKQQWSSTNEPEPAAALLRVSRGCR